MPGEEGSRFQEKRIRIRFIAVPGDRAQAAIASAHHLLAINARDRSFGCDRRSFPPGRVAQRGIENHVGHPPALPSFLQPSRQNYFVPTAWEMVLALS